MVSIECTNASSLKSVILDCLICCILPLSGCCGQAYDGAVVMAGHLIGVVVQIYFNRTLLSMLNTTFNEGLDWDLQLPHPY